MACWEMIFTSQKTIQKISNQKKIIIFLLYLIFSCYYCSIDLKKQPDFKSSNLFLKGFMSFYILYRNVLKLDIKLDSQIFFKENISTIAKLAGFSGIVYKDWVYFQKFN